MQHHDSCEMICLTFFADSVTTTVDSALFSYFIRTELYVIKCIKIQLLRAKSDQQHAIPEMSTSASMMMHQALRSDGIVERVVTKKPCLDHEADSEDDELEPQVTHTEARCSV